MTPDQLATLDLIKADCRRAIELGERATPGPREASTVESVGGASIYGDLNSPHKKDRRLVASGTWDTDMRDSPIIRKIPEHECDANTAHIAHARTFTPFAAKSLLTTIEACMDNITFMGSKRAELALLTIIADYQKETGK